jgi:hypothetical protein
MRTLNDDIRNAFGYPVGLRLSKAQQYAAAVRERNQPPCQCETCRQIELLPAVQRITERWGK